MVTLHLRRAADNPARSSAASAPQGLRRSPATGPHHVSSAGAAIPSDWAPELGWERGSVAAGRAPRVARRAVARAATSSSWPPYGPRPPRPATCSRIALTFRARLWDEAVCSAGHGRGAALRVRCREALLVREPRRRHVDAHNKHIRELRSGSVRVWTVPAPRARQSGHSAARSVQLLLARKHGTSHSAETAEPCRAAGPTLPRASPQSAMADLDPRDVPFSLMRWGRPVPVGEGAAFAADDKDDAETRRETLLRALLGGR